MLFNSLEFLVFFSILLVVQWRLPHRPRNTVLLIASYGFYACWDWRFLSLIIVSTVVDFYCGKQIAAVTTPTIKKRFLTLSIISNLSILGFFKYANFFVQSAIDTLQSIGVNADTWHLEIVLPGGISFYTFQSLSYSIDVYRGEIKPARRLDDFALFVAFFPQLIAGPIERAKRFLPQLERKPTVGYQDLSQGTWLIFWGLFKKVVIADNMAMIVDATFAQESPSAGAVIIASYAFALQIYGDFSGYSDMARGLARLLGYRLTVNFRLPYFATNPSEFWQRWHISLSSWLRDYLYIPLGGNRHGRSKTYRNLILTMLLAGLWHGAAWTFVIWGFYHGLLLTCHRWLTEHHWLPQPTSTFSQKAWHIMAMVGFFHLVCLGWLIFRAESFSQLLTLLSSLVENWHLNNTFAYDLWCIIVFSWPLWLVQVLQHRSGNLNAVMGLPVSVRGVFYATLMLMLLALGQFGSQPFIYFQF